MPNGGGPISADGVPCTIHESEDPRTAIFYREMLKRHDAELKALVEATSKTFSTLKGKINTLEKRVKLILETRVLVRSDGKR